MLSWRDLSVLWPCRCDYVDLDVAVFTNILQEKVDAFGGIAPYLDAQGSLFLKLQDSNRQRAVVNSDGMCLQVHAPCMYLSCIRTCQTSIWPMGPSAVALHHTCFTSIAAQRMASFGQHACTFSAAQQQAVYCFWCQMSDACATDCWLCVVQTHMQMT